MRVETLYPPLTHTLCSAMFQKPRFSLLSEFWAISLKNCKNYSCELVLWDFQWVRTVLGLHFMMVIKTERYVSSSKYDPRSSDFCVCSNHDLSFKLTSRSPPLVKGDLQAVRQPNCRSATLFIGYRLCPTNLLPLGRLRHSSLWLRRLERGRTKVADAP